MRSETSNPAAGKEGSTGGQTDGLGLPHLEVPYVGEEEEDEREGQGPL